MRCGASSDCLHDHVRPWLRDPKEARDGNGYRALAPCHKDTARDLSVSTGGTGRVIWHCFAGCASDKTRNALIMAGVPAGCLPRPAAQVAADLEAIREVVAGKDSHAHKVLRIAAILDGYGDLPPGHRLEALAESCRVSMREAYKARRGGNAR